MSEIEIDKDILDRANMLIDKHDELKIIYLRVSTKDKGQQEEDQLPPVLDFFKLREEECLILATKESAYNVEKQKSRRFNDIIKLIQTIDEDIDKRVYFYSFDRLYRNRKLMEEFYNTSKRTNTSIYSYYEYFINDLAEIQKKLPKDMGWLIEAQQRQLINFFSWMAESESRKLADRLKKSLHVKNGRTFTNKNNLYGRKLKSIDGKPIKDVKKLDRIENYVAKLIVKGFTYNETIEGLAEKKVKISVGYITRLKNKRGLK